MQGEGAPVSQPRLPCCTLVLCSSARVHTHVCTSTNLSASLYRPFHLRMDQLFTAASTPLVRGWCESLCACARPRVHVCVRVTDREKD
eukprot:scaffold330253_cov53-Tisochrysis_lutea.AAC.1